MNRVCEWAIQNLPADRSQHCYGYNECRQGKCERKKAAAQRRKAELAQYRKFPGNDVQQAREARRQRMIADAGGPPLTEEQWAPIREAATVPRGWCTWCETNILKPGGAEVNTRRGWHDGRNGEPDCLWDFYCHTRAPDQLAAIIRRDGPRCACCGEISGRWGGRHPIDPGERRSRPEAYWRKAYPENTYVGPFTQTQWASGLEVDHRLALALVVIEIAPAERWRWWGPMNLQGLCHACHAAKTRADVVKIKAARALDAIPEAI